MLPPQLAWRTMGTSITRPLRWNAGNARPSAHSHDTIAVSGISFSGCGTQELKAAGRGRRRLAPAPCHRSPTGHSVVRDLSLLHQQGSSSHGTHHRRLRRRLRDRRGGRRQLRAHRVRGAEERLLSCGAQLGACAPTQIRPDLRLARSRLQHPWIHHHPSEPGNTDPGCRHPRSDRVGCASCSFHRRVHTEFIDCSGN